MRVQGLFDPRYLGLLLLLGCPLKFGEEDDDEDEDSSDGLLDNLFRVDDTSGGGDDTSGGGDDTGGGGGGEIDFLVSWGNSSVDLIITNGDAAASYWFGMAETGCGDPSSCWYGEDCVYGDLTGNYFYCHPADTDGVSLLYRGDFTNLSVGVETVFTGASFDGTVTYYVEDSSSGDCYVWGHDTSYYSGLGCQ